MTESIHIQGMDELRRKLAQASEKAMPYLKEAMRAAGQQAMTESHKEVPVLTGTLKRSGQLQSVEQDGHQIIVTVGYGGPAIPYALYQHERTDLAHPTGGKAHYLSDPVKAMAGRLGSFLAARIGHRLEQAIAKGA